MARKPVKTFEDYEDASTEKENTTTDARTEEKVLMPVREDTGLYRVVYTAGGEVPDVLKGRWTTFEKVYNAIEAYNNQNKAAA